MSLLTSHERKERQTVNSSIANALSLPGTSSQDHLGMGKITLVERRPRLVIDYGTIVRTGVKYYDYTVMVNNSQIACKALQRQSSCGFGLSDGSMLIEGAKVLVAVPESFQGIGWILGAIPHGRDCTGQSSDKMLIGYSYPACDLSPYDDNAVYNIPYSDKTFKGGNASNSFRPGDILPGEYASLNENHCGFVSTMYDSSITAGSSFVRVGCIDDEIRVRATNFTKWTDARSVKEFNDGGLISVEGGDYEYQNELMDRGSISDGSGYADLNELKERKPHPRTRFWRGFLGNIMSWFCVRPRKTEHNSDIGLASVHVSQSGNVMVRAAGGVSLERYDRIPVPFRMKAEWDPEGDIEDMSSHKPLEYFDLGSDPHAIGLIKSSKMAHDQKIMYQRFDELKKDFKTQNESDTLDPKTSSEYGTDADPFGSHELNLQEYAGRKAGVFIGDDGSVIIRDAWGSEIVMAGGNININTPGSVINMANRNIVSFAGNSVVERGVKAVELSSDTGDTRIHAHKLVAIAGGDDDAQVGGVLIESTSKLENIVVNAEEEAGSTAVVNGVVIKSRSGIGMCAKKTYIRGDDAIAMSTDLDSGIISAAGNRVVNYASTKFTAATDDAIVLMQKGAAVMSANRTSITGDTVGVGGGNGSAAMLGPPVPRSQAAPDHAEFPENGVGGTTKDVLDQNAKFTFRTSEQAGTTTGIEPWRPNQKFTLYQPYWQVSKANGNPLITANPITIKSSKVNGTKCWPGKEASEDGEFVSLKNSNLSTGDLSKPRDKVESKVSVERESLSNLRI